MVFNDGFDLLVFHGVGLQFAPCGRLAKTMVNIVFSVQYFNVFLNRFSCAFGIFRNHWKIKRFRFFGIYMDSKTQHSGIVINHNKNNGLRALRNSRLQESKINYQYAYKNTNTEYIQIINNTYLSVFWVIWFGKTNGKQTLIVKQNYTKSILKTLFSTNCCFKNIQKSYI